MRRRPAHIPQRLLAFLGCEGEGERAYGALLQDLANQLNLAIALRPHILNPGAGNPLELVRRAVQRLQQEQRRGTIFPVRWVILDEDRCADDPAQCTQARQLAAAENIQLLWQQPDHEAFLLRHMPNCHTLRPPRGAALARLRQHWAEYQKPASAAQLAQRIDVARIAIVRTVEPQLHAFLQQLNWP
jgi:hypothetical protein